MKPLLYLNRLTRVPEEPRPAMLTVEWMRAHGWDHLEIASYQLGFTDGMAVTFHRKRPTDSTFSDH